MKLTEIIDQLGLEVRVAGEDMDVDVTSGYASDMLSDVMGHAQEGAIWITLQTHQNIVAVAVMKSLAAIILIKGREPDEDTVRKAKDEGIPILISQESAFALAGKLHAMGIAGE